MKSNLFNDESEICSPAEGSAQIRRQQSEINGGGTGGTAAELSIDRDCCASMVVALHCLTSRAPRPFQRHDFISKPASQAFEPGRSGRNVALPRVFQGPGVAPIHCIQRYQKEIGETHSGDGLH